MKHVAPFDGKVNEQFSRLGLPGNLKTEQPVPFTTSKWASPIVIW